MTENIKSVCHRYDEEEAKYYLAGIERRCHGRPTKPTSRPLRLSTRSSLSSSFTASITSRANTTELGIQLLPKRILDRARRALRSARSLAMKKPPGASRTTTHPKRRRKALSYDSIVGTGLAFLFSPVRALPPIDSYRAVDPRVSAVRPIIHSNRKELVMENQFTSYSDADLFRLGRRSRAAGCHRHPDASMKPAPSSSSPNPDWLTTPQCGKGQGHPRNRQALDSCLHSVGGSHEMSEQFENRRSRGSSATFPLAPIPGKLR